MNSNLDKKRPIVNSLRKIKPQDSKELTQQQNLLILDHLQKVQTILKSVITLKSKQMLELKHGSKQKTTKYCHQILGLPLKEPCGGRSIQISTTSLMTLFLKYIYILIALSIECHSTRKHTETNKESSSSMSFASGENSSKKTAKKLSSHPLQLLKKS